MNPEVRSSETVLQATFETDRMGSKPNSEAVQAVRSISRVDSDEAAIKMMSEWKPIDVAEAHKLNDQIGSKRDKNGKKDRSTNEVARFKTAETHTTTIVKLIQEGYDKLDSDEKDIVEHSIEAAFDQWPDAKEFFALYPPAKTKAMEEFRKNPLLLLKTRAAFEAFLKDPKNRLAEPDKVNKAKLDLDRAEKQLEELKHQAPTNIDAEIAGTLAELDEYRPPNPSATPPFPGGTRWQKMNRLEVNENVAAKQAGLGLRQKQLEELKGLLDAAKHGTINPAFTNVDINAIQSDYNNLNNSIQTDVQVIKEYEALLQRNEYLKQRKEGLEKEKTSIADQEKTVSGLKGTFEDAKKQRETEEKAYVGKLGGVLVEGAMHVMGERATAYREGQKELVREMERNAEAPADRAITNALANRWNTRKRHRLLGFLPRYREENRRKGERIERDYHLLLTKGPRELMKRILESQGVGELDVQRALASREFNDKYKHVMTATLLRRRWEKQKLSTSDSRRMAETDWGRQMIATAFSHDQVVSGQLKHLADACKIKGPIQDWIANHSDGEVAAVFGAAAGTLAAAGVVAGPPAVAAVSKAVAEGKAIIGGASAVLGLGGRAVEGSSPSISQIAQSSGLTESAASNPGVSGVANKGLGNPGSSEVTPGGLRKAA